MINSDADHCLNFLVNGHNGLSQCQAKESTEIPPKVYDKINREFRKNCYSKGDIKKMTLHKLKKILKKLHLNSYYEHTPHILSKLTGRPPPNFSRETEETLRQMFKMIQMPFLRHKPAYRVNFLSYSYVLHKFCQLLELDDLLKCFPLLKSRDKLQVQDEIWRKICEDLRWEYHPSI
jgi:hypothetical protein